jgi:uncharacterized membrane protein
MPNTLRFFKSTLIRGALFLVPLMLALVLLREAVGLIARLLRPITEALPQQSLIGISVSELLAAFILLGIGFVAGLLAQTTLGTQLSSRIERLVLRKMPGYTLLKSVAQGKLGTAAETNVQVGLIRASTGWQIVFIMERHPNGLLTIFAPSAPSPTAGNVSFIREQEVELTDLSVATAIGCLTQLGTGSQALLEQLKNQLLDKE